MCKKTSSEQEETQICKEMSSELEEELIRKEVSLEQKKTICTEASLKQENEKYLRK